MGKHILLFDIASENGNIAILCDNVVVDIMTLGGGNIKTESVLSKVETLLARNRIDRKKIGEILYVDISVGAGNSLTGKRIFRSILLGLKNSLNLQVQEISSSEISHILETHSLMKFDKKQ